MRITSLSISGLPKPAHLAIGHTEVTQRFGLTVVTTNSSSVAAGPSETLVEAVNATTGAVLSSGKRLCIGPNLNYYDAIVPSSTEPKFK